MNQLSTQPSPPSPLPYRSGKGEGWTWVAVATAASLVSFTIYYFTQPTAPPITLACPLQVEERAQHPGMVWVPAGTVEMGSDVYPEETRRTASVEPSRITVSPSEPAVTSSLPSGENVACIKLP